MSHFLRILVLVVFGIQGAYAQSFRAELKAGQKALAKADYYTALHHFNQIIDHKDADSRLWFDYARAAQAMNAFEVAEKYFQKIIDTEGYNLFPSTNYHIAEIHKTLGQYELARADFQRFLQQKVVPDSLRAPAQRQLTDLEWVVTLEVDYSVQVKNMGRRVNTPYSEFGVFPWRDTLYYSSYRYPLEGDKYEPQRKISKLMFARGGSRGRVVGRQFSADTLHTAHSTISPQGDRIYFTQCTYVNGTRIQCQLVYRDRIKRGRWSAKVKMLPGHINLAGYTHTQPSIGYDSLLQQEVLYYSSDRPGGKGGLDLWYVYPPLNNASWPDPLPLEAVNTAMDELTPYWHTAQQRLYFASDGYPNLGGYDIFVTYPVQQQKWQKPVNLGPPINSSYNDLYFATTSSGAQSYFSSNRPGSAYLDKDFQACCFDLYVVTKAPKDEQGDPLVTTPALPTATDIPEKPDLEPRPPTTLEEFLPLALYFDNDEPDQRTRHTQTKKSYKDTYQSYWNRRTAYYKSYPDRDQLDLFFTDEVKANFDKLNRFSAMLLQQLKTGEEIEIFLQGFTSPRAEGDYNLRLGKRRVSAVRNHFDEYENGAFLSYLIDGQLVITEISFGETQAAEHVSDDLQDEAASIYSPAAARERRVEIVEVERE